MITFIFFLFFVCFDLASCQSVEELKSEAIKWRKRASEMECNSHHHNKILESGAWCLKPPKPDHPSFSVWKNANPIYLPGASDHVPPDEGIAAAMSKFFLEFSKGNNVTLFDIGAGIGQYGKYFQHYQPKIAWEGYDGAGNIETFTDNFVKWIDVTNPIYDTITGKRDFVLSLEIGEHIPKETTESFLNIIDAHNNYGIVLSWAVPNQPGYGHINRRSNEDVVKLLKAKGYEQTKFSMKLQTEGRKSAKYFWFRDSFMIFVRKGVVYSKRA